MWAPPLLCPPPRQRPPPPPPPFAFAKLGKPSETRIPHASSGKRRLIELRLFNIFHRRHGRGRPQNCLAREDRWLRAREIHANAPFQPDTTLRRPPVDS